MSLLDPKHVAEAARGDQAFLHSLRFLTGLIRFSVGEAHYLLSFSDGAFVDFALEDGASHRPVDVTLAGTEDDWKKLLALETAPGCQNPLYNDGRSGISKSGDTIKAIGPFARLINEFYRIMAFVVSGREIDCVLPEVDRDFDSVVGRYMYLHIEGVQYRIYFEEAGTGPIPLFFQHTAGADSRQFRYLMEDADFQKHFRMIAYDMPYHGRSLPPTSHKWWNERFLLTKSFLLQAVSGICDKLNLVQPIFLGSAMGGMLALDLAYYLPGQFRAVIGLNAGPPADFDQSVLDQMATFSHPNINGHWQSTMMVANMAGSSPGVYRRELGWVYSQSAPGAAEGALNYYSHEHDLTPAQAATIDRSKTAVYLFTGQDDFMGTEYGSCLLVAEMTGVPFIELKDLGHFGAAENPLALKRDLWPTLMKIARDT